MSQCRFRLIRPLWLALLVVPTLLAGELPSDSPAATSPPPRLWTPGPLFDIGTPSPDSIRVAIFGYCVKRPGYYFLPRGATVRDALEAAKPEKGGIEIGWAKPYSGIQRLKADGSPETIWFNYKTRSADEQIGLQDGDLLQLSHEVY